jgi:hypothetical protein
MEPAESVRRQVSCLFRTEIRSAVEQAIPGQEYQQAEQEIFDPVYQSLEQLWVRIRQQLDRDLT